MRRAITALVTAGACALAAAPAAFAHAEVEARTPGPGKTVSQAKQVSIRFSQSLTTGLISVTRDGSEVTATQTGLNPRKKSVLRATFSRGLPAGSYTVTWRALAPDGHRQNGTWTFRVR